MNVSPEQEAALHAKLDELMTNGEQSFIHVHGAGRLAVPAEILEKCGYKSGQIVTAEAATTLILENEAAMVTLQAKLFERYEL